MWCRQFPAADVAASGEEDVIARLDLKGDFIPDTLAAQVGGRRSTRRRRGHGLL